jgi:hypothetical protein
LRFYKSTNVSPPFVAQIANLLFRRLPIGGTSDRSHAREFPSRTANPFVAQNCILLYRIAFCRACVDSSALSFICKCNYGSLVLQILARPHAVTTINRQISYSGGRNSKLPPERVRPGQCHWVLAHNNGPSRAAFVPQANRLSRPAPVPKGHPDNSPPLQWWVRRAKRITSPEGTAES